jgi:hypothetical protein
MPFLNIILGLLLVVCGLMTAAAAATVFSLRSSDPAGNGLAEAYLAVTVVGLWGLIGLSLILAALRRDRRALPWINVVTFVVFAVGAAAQLGTLEQLSGHRSEGAYRVILQMAVIVAPVAALLHIAWRGLSSQAPNWWATKLAAGLVILASVTPLWGPRRAPVAERLPDPLAELVFPAVMVREGGSLIVVNSAGELRHMPAQFVLPASSPPFLIDGRFEIFVLRDLRPASGARGTDPAGATAVDVLFDLIDWEPDATADAALNVLLRASAFGSNPEQDAAIRRKLAAETTLEGMIGVLRSGAG